MKKIKWRYALGEILIVILGISIAFSMNKYAEEKRDKKLKNQYVESLISDLEADKTILEDNITRMNQKIDTIAPLLKQLTKDTPNKIRLTKNIIAGSIITEFRPQDVTYKTLINAGDLKLFDDLELKKSIQRHYSQTYGELRSAYERVENINAKYLADYYIYNNFMDFTLRAGVNFKFKDEKLLKGIFFSISNSIRLKLYRAEQGIKSCEALIQKLKEESE
ncbi:DUF6090 family protein [Spongiivirga sp. MCCC 1A20706]|uniref:DUF6090 family protein n=1 Tax=Spongiivirga sp. MCCC 1A20706 TaxID=3160963 RepID=UPI003977948B